MALQNKIEHFMEVSIKDAKKQRDSVLQDYEKGLLALFESHKEEAKKNAALQEKIEAENLKRHAYKVYLKESLELKRKYSLRQKELSDSVFEEVKQMLAEFKKTKDYEDLLLKQILAALNVSGKEDLTIYIDPEDQHLMGSLAKRANKELTLSKYSFGGGIRAVVFSKNILIDNSFDARLAEARESCKLTL